MKSELRIQKNKIRISNFDVLTWPWYGFYRLHIRLNVRLMFIYILLSYCLLVKINLVPFVGHDTNKIYFFLRFFINISKQLQIAILHGFFLFYICIRPYIHICIAYTRHNFIALWHLLTLQFGTIQLLFSIHENGVHSSNRGNWSRCNFEKLMLKLFFFFRERENFPRAHRLPIKWKTRFLFEEPLFWSVYCVEIDLIYIICYWFV